MIEKNTITSIRRRYENELFERVIPFWEAHSLDRSHGGYFNCLDRDGSVYDTTKHVWLQGRQVWMFSKLFRRVEAKPQWLEAARLGVDFLLEHALLPDGQVAFALSQDGQLAAVQRKIFSACFLALALAEYGRASQKPEFVQQAESLFERILQWTEHPERLGRPQLPGDPPLNNLAVPMILLNLMEEIADGDTRRFASEVDTCLKRVLLHLDTDRQVVLENVTPSGAPCNSTPAGRLLNPGHAIEAGWFVMHWAQHLQRPDLTEAASNMIRWSFQRGWDRTHGGLFYFLDADGFSPIQLEWSMKLWWPHCESLYANLLNYHVTGETRDWEAFCLTDNYAFSRFRDEEFGEWYGYLDRYGETTHRFKGGPYKGCFHLPRSLWLCWQLLKTMEDEAS